MDIPITGDAATWAGVLVAGGGLWISLRSVTQTQRRETADQHERVMAEIERSRQASEDGRLKIYERIESVERQLTNALVSKELHEADLRLVHHSLQEQNTALLALANRLDASCRQRGRRFARESNAA